VLNAALDRLTEFLSAGPILALWVVLAFVVGAVAGSLLNVCVARLPYEKSILWPLGSRCGHCLQPIRWYDNVPLVSYWVLRGRCRTCGARFSVRYFLVELFTGLAFAGLFYLEIERNVLGLPFLEQQQFAIAWGAIPLKAWLVFLPHAVLLSFLIVTSVCDLNDMEIPLSVTVTGTLVGLTCAALFPWPFPSDLAPLPPPDPRGLANPTPLALGIYPWPVWYPLPGWLPAGSWQLGLATGLAGALAGMVILRGVRFLFGLGRGIEGLGMGDADLMMMAGSFVGWQPVVVAFFAAVFPALFFGVAQVLRGKGQALPFGPSLAAGVVLTLLGWRWLLTRSPALQELFFDPLVLLILGGGGALALLVTSFLLRLLRGTEVGGAGVS
jgi:leader peptidase (prepilin peptidase)/N-methyltransferase